MTTSQALDLMTKKVSGNGGSDCETAARQTVVLQLPTYYADTRAGLRGEHYQSKHELRSA